jgi:hypothetical protein
MKKILTAKSAKQIIVFTVDLDFPPFSVGTMPMGFPGGRGGTVSPFGNRGKHTR